VRGNGKAAAVVVGAEGEGNLEALFRIVVAAGLRPFDDGGGLGVCEKLLDADVARFPEATR